MSNRKPRTSGAAAATSRNPRRRRRRFPLALFGVVVFSACVGVLAALTVFGVLPPTPAAAPPDTRNAAGEASGAAAVDPSSPAPSASASATEPPVLSRSVEEEVTSGSGELETVAGESEVAGDGPLRRYSVKVEAGLPGDPADFAAAVERILGDQRSWIGEKDLAVRRVDSGADFEVVLAAPDTVDALCAPLRTNGTVSCAQGNRAIINQNRWVSGVEHFDGDLEKYRVYVINHEVGHTLGHGHVACPEAGETAPVMQQQTLGLDGCEPNGWVTSGR